MWQRIISDLKRLRGDEQGAAMVEYAIVTAVIAVMALTATQAVGSAIVGVFNDIVTALTSI